MSEIPQQIIAFFETEFAKLTDPEKAIGMAAYMKNRFDFIGIQKPERKKVNSKFKKEFRNIVNKEMTNTDYRKTVKLLINNGPREYHYTASFFVEYAKKFMSFDNIDLYKEMIIKGDWWDTTDYEAANYIAHVLRVEPKKTRPILDQWIEDDNMWIRRAALLSQLKFKADTDTEMLASYIESLIHEDEFFIRKAIGWMLREYSKTDKTFVKKFIEDHQDQLSKLSIREGSKYLNK